MNRVSRLPIRRNNKKRYYKHIEYPEISREINDLYITTSFGDRLDTLANLYYGDSSLWWIISCGNPGVVRRDSFYTSRYTIKNTLSGRRNKKTI